MNDIVDKKGQPLLPKLPKLNEKVCFFAVAGGFAFKDSVTFFKSLTKFHSPKEISMILFTDQKDINELEKLPKGIEIRDLTPFLQDPMFYYRQKPILGEELLKEFDLVVGFDVDQIVLGTLEDIIKVKTYDVGVVVNWNRHDEKFYPLVHMMPYIQPIEYFNCGMVAMRSKKFVHDWKVWCFKSNFDKSQYKEQDGLNFLTHHGNYSVWCFDMPSSNEGDIHWFGILSKGELANAYIEDGMVTIDKGIGKSPFPPRRVRVHLIHMGGGGGAPKDNWGAICSPALMQYIEDEVLK